MSASVAASAQQAAGQQIARDQLLHDGAGGNGRILDLHHGLMELGVERLAQRLDPGDAVAFEHRLQLALGGLHAGDDGAQRRIERLEVGRQRRKRAAEVVGDRQDVARKAFDAELVGLFDVLLGAAADILRVGDGPQVLVLQVGVLGLEALDHALQGLDGDFGAVDRHVIRGAARG